MHVILTGWCGFMYKIPMFPQNYTHSDHAAVRWNIDLLERGIGLEQAVFPPFVIAAANVLERAQQLDGETLAALVLIPLRGSSSFARADLKIQMLAMALNEGLVTPDVTVEAYGDRLLTAKPQIARFALACLIAETEAEPLPRSRKGDFSWYQRACMLAYLGERLATPEAVALLSPALLRLYAEMTPRVLKALSDIDPAEVDKLPELRVRLSMLMEKVERSAQKVDHKAATAARLAAEAEAARCNLYGKLKNKARQGPRL